MGNPHDDLTFTEGTYLSIKEQHNANINGEDLYRYSLMVACLANLKGANAISDEEYDDIKGKLMKDYKVLSDWTVARTDFSSRKEHVDERIN